MDECHCLGFCLLGKTVRFWAEIFKYLAPGGIYDATHINNRLWTASKKAC